MNRKKFDLSNVDRKEEIQDINIDEDGSNDPGSGNEKKENYDEDNLGDIYENDQASLAFALQKLRSIDVKDSKRLRIAFKNQTPELLTLCWLDWEGKPHHFYSLKPCKTIITDVGGNFPGDGVVFREKNVHIERSALGHAFLIATREYNNTLNIDQHNETENEELYNIRKWSCLGKRLKRKKSISKRDGQESKSRIVNANIKHLDARQVVACYRPRSQMYSRKNSNDDRSLENGSTSSERESSEELCVHIVTITRKRTPSQNSKELTRKDGKKTKLFQDKKGIPTVRTSKVKIINKYEYTYQLTVCGCRLDNTPLDTSNKLYHDMTLGGWPVKCESGLFGLHCHHDVSSYKEEEKMMVREEKLEQVKRRLEKDLKSASLKLPPNARELLRASTPIWININQKYGPKCAPISGKGMCFHPERDWLISNGMSSDKCGGVELYNAEKYLDDVDLWYGSGGVMLHELSHAWHCKFLEGGYENKEILECFELAMKEKLYECVEVHDCGSSKSLKHFGKGQGSKAKRKAYACTNAMEYFAELSTAFLGGVGKDSDLEFNKWFPFNRKQIKEHDPRAYSLLKKMWGINIDSEEDGNNKYDTRAEKCN